VAFDGFASCYHIRNHLAGGITLPSPKLHIEQNVKPAAVKAILQLLDEECLLDTTEIWSQIGNQLWPTLRTVQQRNYLRKNLKTMKALGLISEIRNSSSFLHELTLEGKRVRYLSRFKQSLFAEALHFLHYTAYELEGGLERAFSWTYQQICDVLWKQRPRPIIKKNIIDQVLFNAEESFEGAEEISLSHYAIDGVKNWVGQLTPPFLEVIAGRTTTTRGRRFCSPELLTLSINLLYGRKNLKLGSPLLLTDDSIDEICRTGLVSLDVFDDILTLVLDMDFNVRLQSSQWGRSVFLDKAYTMDNPGGEG